VASTATALARWITAYRELARRSELASSSEPIATALAPPSVPAPARVVISPRVRKVAPIEQH
jgi:hypothetical protein